MKTSPIRQTALTVISAARRIHQWLERCRIRVYAAQASFFVTVSAFPTALLLLTLAGMVLPRGGGAVRERLLQALPEGVGGLVDTVLTEMAAKADLSLLSVSAVTLLWSASRGVRSIGAGIRHVCGGKRQPRFWRYHGQYLLYTLLYILALLLALVIWVLGDILAARLPFGVWSPLSRLLNSLAVLMLLTAVFCLMMRGMSGLSKRMSAWLPGAGLAALGWLLYSRFFEYYLEHLAPYSYLYGSLGAFVVVMLWLYAGLEILLVGTALNVLWLRRVRVV